MKEINLKKIEKFCIKFNSTFPKEINNLLRICSSLDNEKIIKTSQLKNSLMRVFIEYLFYLLNLKNENFNYSKKDDQISFYKLLKKIFNKNTEVKNKQEKNEDTLQNEKFIYGEINEDDKKKSLLEIHREKIDDEKIKNKKFGEKHFHKIFGILNDDRFNLKNNFKRS